MLLFELLKAHGTNIIIQNGSVSGQTIPHFCINIIPRRTDDGLKLDWDMKQANSDSLDSIKRIIEDGMNQSEPKQIIIEKKSENIPSTIQQELTEEEKKPSRNNTNNFLKSLERIP